MASKLDNPLITQSDYSILVEVENPRYSEARDHIGRFAELVKSPEHIHSYRISPLSLWNAASTGLNSDKVLKILEEFNKYSIPANVKKEIEEQMGRYGRLKMIQDGDELLLHCDEQHILRTIWSHKKVQPYLKKWLSDSTIQVDKSNRGLLKQVLIKIGFPVDDQAGYIEGESYDIEFEQFTSEGEPFQLREYQRDASRIFYAGGKSIGGNGVIVLPCGAGKTIVGMAVMSYLRCYTLILCTSISAVKQWKRELLDKTNLKESDVGEYTGEIKNIRPITITTYQLLTYRREKEKGYLHLDLVLSEKWGLIIYDEVHLLPAPVFRITSQIQARRRLGLTATLVREDGREDDVFSLIGPKKYDVPWKVLEKQGWIATANCHELRIALPPELRFEYSTATLRQQFRIAAENYNKEVVLRKLLSQHEDDLVLIIGHYLSQLQEVSSKFKIPLIQGKTPTNEREDLYSRFRRGELKTIIVSKVGNFAIDLPDANVAIQLSGTFGSRQEEAQRLGRILRPKKNGQTANFFTLVSLDTVEEEYALKRQLFLTEQGYLYDIEDA